MGSNPTFPKQLTREYRSNGRTLVFKINYVGSSPTILVLLFGCNRRIGTIFVCDTKGVGSSPTYNLSRKRPTGKALDCKSND